MRARPSSSHLNGARGIVFSDLGPILWIPFLPPLLLCSFPLKADEFLEAFVRIAPYVIGEALMSHVGRSFPVTVGS